METLRHVVVLIHLVGFALLFGAWAVEAYNRRLQVTPLMQWGLGIAALAGLVLAAPWGISYELNYVKLGVKLARSCSRSARSSASARSASARTARCRPAIFWSIGVLTLGNAAIALLWR